MCKGPKTIGWTRGAVPFSCSWTAACCEIQIQESWLTAVQFGKTVKSDSKPQLNLSFKVLFACTYSSFVLLSSKFGEFDQLDQRLAPQLLNCSCWVQEETASCFLPLDTADVLVPRTSQDSSTEVSLGHPGDNPTFNRDSTNKTHFNFQPNCGLLRWLTLTQNNLMKPYVHKRDEKRQKLKTGVNCSFTVLLTIIIINILLAPSVGPYSDKIYNKGK